MSVPYADRQRGHTATEEATSSQRAQVSDPAWTEVGVGAGRDSAGFWESCPVLHPAANSKSRPAAGFRIL